MGGKMNNNTLGTKFVLLVFALTASVSAGISAQVHNKDYYYERARWRLSSGNNAGALEDLNLIVSLTPNDPEAYNTRGVIYERSGDYTAARADYEHALRLNPDSAEAKHNINHLNERLNNLNLANVGTAPPAYIQYPPVQQVTYAPAQSTQQQSYAPVQSVRQSGYTTVQPTQQQNYTPVRSVPRQSYAPAPVKPVQQVTYTPARTAQQSPYGSLQSAPYENKNFLNTSAINYQRAGTNIGIFRQTVAPAVSYGYLQVLQPAAFQSGAGIYEQPAYNMLVRKPFVDTAAEDCNNYGVALNSYGRFEEAVLKFTEAIEIYPEYAIAYNNRGVAYASIGDSVRATEDFIKALRINPYYFDAQTNYQRINGNVNVAAITQ
jgi:Flp pilus assembly protein TadD